MGPRAGLDRDGKSRPPGIRSPDRPARSSVAIPTELPGPHQRTVSLLFSLRFWLSYLTIIQEGVLTTKRQYLRTEQTALALTIVVKLDRKLQQRN